MMLYSSSPGGFYSEIPTIIFNVLKIELCISCFSCCSEKMPDIIITKRFILVHSLREDIVHHNGTGTLVGQEVLVILHLQSGSGEMNTDA